jgi:hypothetical protein
MRTPWLSILGAAGVGLLAGFLVGSRGNPSGKLIDQAFPLTRIAKDAVTYRATPETIAGRVRQKVDTKAEFDPAEPTTIALSPVTNPLGMGSRWLLHLSLGKDRRIDRAWLELQPQGYP